MFELLMAHVDVTRDQMLRMSVFVGREGVFRLLLGRIKFHKAEICWHSRWQDLGVESQEEVLLQQED